MASQHAALPSDPGNRLRKIAVVGVSGTAGSRIVAEASKNPQFTITAVTREDSTAEVPAGVHTAKVNYDDKASLVTALRGQDVLVITLSVAAPYETQIKLIDAAVEAGVPWILPNEYGNDPTEEVGRDTLIGPPMKKVRDYIQTKKGISWIGIACGFWYEFSFAGGIERFGFDWKTKEAELFDGGDRRASSSTWAQVGKCVAALLALPVHKEDGSKASLDDFKNRFCHFASFTLSQNDMLASIRRVKPDWEWSTKSVDVKEFYKTGMEEFQKGETKGFSKCLYSRFFYPDNEGDMEARHGLDNDKLGVPMEDVDEATRRAVALFESGYFDKQYQ